jgi:hypothetical protein
LEGEALPELGMGWKPYRYADGKFTFRPEIMDKRLAVGELIRRERPDIKWGWWGYVNCEENDWAHSGLTEQWYSLSEAMKPLGQQADFLVPPHYQVSPDFRYPLGPSSFRDLTRQCEIIGRKCEVLARMHPGKSRYMMLHTQWYDRHTANREDIEIDWHSFEALLRKAYYGGLSDRGGFGVASWTQPRPPVPPGSPLVYQRWDESKDWFRVLKRLLDEEGITPG